MKVYLSGGFVYMRDLELEKKLNTLGVQNRLYSYFYLRSKPKFREIFHKVLEEDVFNVMIDSGAHSVATMKEAVSVEEYGKWLVSLGGMPRSVYINLDVVPYQHGDEIPPASRWDQSAEEGWENLKYLESLGLKPIHVFHGGENQKWLDKLIDNYDYIGIAASRLATGISERYGFLDTCWKKLTDDKGKPIRKVHGFALTSPEIMIRYPWYSLDSSTWGQFGVYGGILIPTFHRSKLAYSHVFVSPRSPKQRGKGHYYTLSDEEKKNVDEFIKECGLTTEQVLNEKVGALLKDVINIKFLLKLEDEISKRRKVDLPIQKGFFT